jgi:hypothetical protein
VLKKYTWKKMKTPLGNEERRTNWLMRLWMLLKLAMKMMAKIPGS